MEYMDVMVRQCSPYEKALAEQERGKKKFSWL